MRTEEQTYQLFEDYIADRLKAEDKLSFEKELLNNSELNTEFEMHKGVHQLVAIGSLYELEKRVKNFKPKSGGKGLLTSWLMAIALIAGMTSWLVIHQLGPKKVTEGKVTDVSAVLVEDQNLEKEVEEDPHAHIRGRANHKREKGLSNSTNEEVNQELSGKDEQADIQEYDLVQVMEENTETELIEKEEKDDRKAKEIESDKTIDLCSDVVLTANVNATTTCQGVSEGSIILTRIKGGAQPYSVSINNKQPQKYTVFDNLEVGEYNLTLYDANACSTKIGSAKITSKVCGSGVNDAFTPSLGQTFNVPDIDNQSGTFEVYDVYNSLRVSLKFYSELNWDGQDEYGGLLSSGEYIYKVILDNGQIKTGSVSIIQ